MNEEMISYSSLSMTSPLQLVPRLGDKMLNRFRICTATANNRWQTNSSFFWFYPEILLWFCEMVNYSQKQSEFNSSFSHSSHVFLSIEVAAHVVKYTHICVHIHFTHTHAYIYIYTHQILIPGRLISIFNSISFPPWNVRLTWLDIGEPSRMFRIGPIAMVQWFSGSRIMSEFGDSIKCGSTRARLSVFTSVHLCMLLSSIILLRVEFIRY